MYKAVGTVRRAPIRAERSDFHGQHTTHDGPSHRNSRRPQRRPPRSKEKIHMDGMRGADEMRGGRRLQVQYSPATTRRRHRLRETS